MDEKESTWYRGMDWAENGAVEEKRRRRGAAAALRNATKLERIARIELFCCKISMAFCETGEIGRISR